MRSINIKKAVAIAAGAAMVASVLTPALATVGPSQDDVDALVANIKANPADVSIVVGTNGAEITDGIAAAKIAAVLATLNYEQTEITSDDLTCTTDGTPSVDVEVSGAATPTDSTQYMELGQLASTGTDYSATASSSLTITKENMKDVLSQKTLTISDNSTGTMTQHTYYYEDKITLLGGTSGLKAKYSEDPTGNGGHGLYLYVPAGALKYTIDFGSGIPVGSGVNYQETPEVTILGKDYGLDWKNTESGKISFYTGTKTVVSIGDVVTTDDGVQVKFSYGTGTDTAEGTFHIIGPDGSEADTNSLAAGESFTTTIDGVKVTITVESIGYNAADGTYTAQIRIGTGSQYFESGDAFPGNTDWVVDSVTVSGSKLTGLTLRYNKNYLGTYDNGLAQGTPIDGPLMNDGTPLFQVVLEGYGSVSTDYKTTELTFKGMGQAAESSELIQATWYSRDGVLQTFAPEYPTQANITVGNMSALGWNVKGTVLNSQDSKGYISKWTIINDKVVYLDSVSKADDGTYSVVFRIAGKDGQTVEYSGLSNNTNTTFSYNSPNLPISCNFRVEDYVGTTSIDRRLVLLANGTNCVLDADAVQFGKKLDMSTAGKLNFTNALAGNSDPTIVVTAPSTDVIVVKYNDSTGIADKQSGMQAGTASSVNAYIDQTNPTTFAYDSNKYHETIKSTEIDGSTLGEVKMTVPDQARNALIRVTGQATTTAGTQNVKEGDTVSGVKIVKINVPEYTVSGAVTGTYYTKKDASFTEANIIKDTDAITTTYAIVVGGPFVNSVAQQMTAADLITQEGASYVYAEGDKLLVAGYSATDTMAAANELIALLKA